MQNEFLVGKIVPSSPWQVETHRQRFPGDQREPSAEAGAQARSRRDFFFGSTRSRRDLHGRACDRGHTRSPGPVPGIDPSECDRGELERVELRSRRCGVLRPTAGQAFSSRPDDREIIALDSCVERHKTGDDRQRPGRSVESKMLLCKARWRRDDRVAQQRSCGSGLPRIRISLAEPEPINGQLLRQKLLLKIGERITFVHPVRRIPEIRLAGYLRDLLKVGFVISLDPELSVIDQAAIDCLQKLTVNNPANVMPPLWPGVRKI